MEGSIYINREDARKEETDIRNEFIRGVLEELGLPVDKIWPELDLTVEQKIELRDLLEKTNVEIIDDSDRGYKIYSDRDLIAEWFKPRFILKKDLGARTAKKKLYYEMQIKTWTIFEEHEEKENE